MSIFENVDFDSILAGIVYDSRVQSPDCDIMTDEEYDEAMKDHVLNDEWEDDGQPTHYEECQDLYDGDDYVEQWEVESWD